MRMALRYGGGETFLATYGDGVADIDLDRLLMHHRASGKLATVTAVRPSSRFGEVSIRNVGGKTRTSVNLRAPVFLDALNRTGWQYVMSNGAYQVRHVLTSLDEIIPVAGDAD